MQMKKWIVLNACLLAGSVSFAGHVESYKSSAMPDGAFVGLSANFNSIIVTQNSFGLGISNIQTNTGSNSNGVASGDRITFFHRLGL
jgi:hypothetical protein